MRLVFVLFTAIALASLQAQEDDTPPEVATKPPVTLVFTPPDLEGAIVLGIFDSTGKLKRTLHFQPGAPELVIDTNGYIVKWDGRDETGKPCAAGRYSARGYVVGDEVNIDGRAFYFNDWMAEDHIPAQSVSLLQGPEGVGVELKTAKGQVYEQIQADGTLRRISDPRDWTPGTVRPHLKLTPVSWAAGRDDTTWAIVKEDGRNVVAQFEKNDDSPRRELRVPEDEPQPVEIAASSKEDAILLKEIGGDGMQRVRLLKRGQSAAEKDGRVIADWEVVFERTLQPCEKFGLVGGRLVADAGLAPQGNGLDVSLVENALEPGKKQSLKLRAAATNPGSALVSPDGLELVGVSERGNWKRFVLSGDGHHATLYQGDGVVVEEFAIESLDHIAAFDAGAFLLAAPVQ